MLANWLPDPDAPRYLNSPWPFIIAVLLGFAIGIFGHIIKSKPLVALGIAMIFFVTVVLPLVLLQSQ